MLPSLSGLELARLGRRADATDAFVIFDKDDPKTPWLDESQKPRVCPISDEDIVPGIPVYAMTLYGGDNEEPSLFNAQALWKAALTNPLKVPVRPLRPDEWADLKAMFGLYPNDNDKAAIRRAERILARHWGTNPGASQSPPTPDAPRRRPPPPAAAVPDLTAMREEERAADAAAGRAGPPGARTRREDGENRVQVQTWIWWRRFTMQDRYDPDSLKRAFINEVALNTILEPADLADLEVEWTAPMPGRQHQSANALSRSEPAQHRRVTFALITTNPRTVTMMEQFFLGELSETQQAARWARLLGVDASLVVKGVAPGLRRAYVNEPLPNPRGDGSLYGIENGDRVYW